MIPCPWCPSNVISLVEFSEHVQAEHSPMKTCGCGRVYSRSQWEALPLAGVQRAPAEEGLPAMAFELRNCRCGSTISVEVET